MSFQTGPGRVTLLLLIAIAGQGSDAIAQGPAVQYIPLKASELPAKARSLLGQNVEVFADFFTTPINIGPGALAGYFTSAEHGGGTQFLDVVFDRADSTAVRWMVDNGCRQTCRGVFVLGKVVLPARLAQPPALAMPEISYESKTGAAVAGSDLAATVAALERQGAAKPLLPPHAMLPKPSVAAPLPPPAATNDSTKSKQRLKPGVSSEMWQSMVNHADSVGARANDDALLIIRGPERPATFETSYRSIRNTGLWMLFEPFPYQDMTTLWPRVAIVVQEKPEFRTFRGENPDAGYAERLIRMLDAKLRQGTLPSQFFANGQPATDYCWRLWAKVWTGPARSEDITPFNWCYSETRFNESLSPVSKWGSSPKTNMLLNHISTGTTRTTGPVPPETPLPLAYHPLYAPTTPMVGSLLLDMGIPLDPVVPDGRVWFLEDSAPYTRPEPTAAPVSNPATVAAAPPVAAALTPKAPETTPTFAAIVADVRRGKVFLPVGTADGVRCDAEYPILRRAGSVTTPVGKIKIIEARESSAVGVVMAGDARFFDCVVACPPGGIKQSSPQKVEPTTCGTTPP